MRKALLDFRAAVSRRVWIVSSGARRRRYSTAEAARTPSCGVGQDYPAGETTATKIHARSFAAGTIRVGTPVRHSTTDISHKFSRPVTADAAAPGFSPSGVDDVVERLDRFAYWSDDCIPIPGLNARVGLEPLVGLVPVWGDVISAVVSCYVPYEAYRLGVPPSLIFKMLVIIIVDALVGSIPVAGDFIDAAVKANKMNVELLKDHLGL
jgi:hypothetical protein